LESEANGKIVIAVNKLKVPVINLGVAQLKKFLFAIFVSRAGVLKSWEILTFQF
jgi:hypothetical protein